MDNNKSSPIIIKNFCSQTLSYLKGYELFIRNRDRLCKQQDFLQINGNSVSWTSMKCNSEKLCQKLRDKINEYATYNTDSYHKINSIHREIIDYWLQSLEDEVPDSDRDIVKYQNNVTSQICKDAVQKYKHAEDCFTSLMKTKNLSMVSDQLSWNKIKHMNDKLCRQVLGVEHDSPKLLTMLTSVEAINSSRLWMEKRCIDLTDRKSPSGIDHPLNLNEFVDLLKLNLSVYKSKIDVLDAVCESGHMKSVYSKDFKLYEAIASKIKTYRIVIQNCHDMDEGIHKESLDDCAQSYFN